MLLMLASRKGVCRQNGKGETQQTIERLTRETTQQNTIRRFTKIGSVHKLAKRVGGSRAVRNEWLSG